MSASLNKTFPSLLDLSKKLYIVLSYFILLNNIFNLVCLDSFVSSNRPSSVSRRGHLHGRVWDFAQGEAEVLPGYRTHQQRADRLPVHRVGRRLESPRPQPSDHARPDRSDRRRILLNNNTHFEKKNERKRKD